MEKTSAARPSRSFLCGQMADAQCRLDRHLRLEYGFFASGSEQPLSPTGPKALAALARIENSLRRAHHRAAGLLRETRASKVPSAS